MSHDLRHCSGSRGYDGKTRGHRFHEDDPEPLLQGWEAEHVRLEVCRTNVVVTGYGTSE